MKRIISLVLVLAMWLSMSVAVFAANETPKSTTQISIATSMKDSEKSVDSSPEDLVDTVLNWIENFQAIWWIIETVDNGLFQREPQELYYGGNWAASSSGSVSFGNAFNLADAAEFPVTIDIGYQRLDAFAQTSLTGLFKEIRIKIRGHSSGVILNDVVLPGQYVHTDTNIDMDSYTVSFLSTGPRNWDCWVYRFDFANNDIEGELKVGSPETTATNMVRDPVAHKVYVVPANAFSSGNAVMRTAAALTAQGLFDEFYDNELKCSVNMMKNYDVGDTVLVSDIITGIEYDEDADITNIHFGNTVDGPFEWPFAGDLRDEFEVNDQVTFEFTVVEEYATKEYSFETLDYFLSANDFISKGVAADIEDYIMR